MKGIFLDRDGVIIRKAPEGDYVRSWNEVEFLPGSLEAIAAFSRRGYKVIIITNQRGIATGKIEATHLQNIHDKIKEVVHCNGGQITGIYHCPHDKPEQCQCRKPKPGMLLRAANEHKLRLSECWMIGDACSDIEAGRSVGCRTVFISRATESCSHPGMPEVRVETLEAAAKYILSSTESQPLATLQEPTKN
jgi:D-glycero-D-manno-heptose 1,7-bisphosphate phosphatase